MASEASKQAFLAEQYRLHGERVFARCFVMGGGNASWAEDVTHDVFIRLMEKPPKVEPGHSLAGWLLTVAYRLCADRLRHERSWLQRVRHLFVASAPASQDDVPQASSSNVELRRRWLEDSMETLSPQERTVMVMKYVDGLRQNEIAARLGLSNGYVSKLLKRAGLALRERGWEVVDD